MDEESLKTRVLKPVSDWQGYIKEYQRWFVQESVASPFYRIAKEYCFVSKSLTIVEEAFEGRLGSRLKLFWIQ